MPHINDKSHRPVHLLYNRRRAATLFLTLLFLPAKITLGASFLPVARQIYENPLCQQYSKEQAPYGESFIESIQGSQLEFVWIPGGCFIMGSESGSDDETPEHLVALHGFYMGKYEVTNEQYRKFNNKHKPKGYGGESLNGEKQPAVSISKKNAQKYIVWLAEKSSKNYRLPTEAEWEYAARGSAARKGENSAYFWGDSLDKACRYANVADKMVERVGLSSLFNCKDNYPVTSPVGSFIANDYGLHDMLGNVWEWCLDTYKRDYYQSGFIDNPLGPQKSGKYSVIRGGSWNFIPWYIRSSGRYYFKPDEGNHIIGFRLALPVR